MYKIYLENLHTNWLAQEVMHYETIDSTQKEIWRKIQNKNINNGTLIIADIQTNGIGTHGRKWYANEKGNINFSFVIYPNISINKLENLTLEIAQIILIVFENLYKIKLDIKAPNDIMINNKKIGGILTETKLLAEKVECLVIDIAINTNKKILQKEIQNTSTSIQKEFNIEINNYSIISEFCNIFEKRFIERFTR